MPKKTWTEISMPIFEKITNNTAALANGQSQDIVVISDDEWQRLFDASDTHSKCDTVYQWMTSRVVDEPVWIQKFYIKLKELSNGSFKHLRIIAYIAKERKDTDTLKDCLARMISLAEKNEVKAWWASIMALLSKDDPRWQHAKEKRAAIPVRKRG